jgi:hypothetical protein
LCSSSVKVSEIQPRGYKTAHREARIFPPSGGNSSARR